jgi:phosphatidylglycerophosphate synthase
MLVAGLGAAVVLSVPHWWTALLAVVLVQVQLLLDCSDGELARWRGQTGPTGIYVDRLGHYVTDAGLAAAVGVHADGGLRSVGGWTTLGLVAAVLVLLTKAETDLVHVARAASGLGRVADDTSTAASRRSLLRRVRSAVVHFPFHRLLLAVELSTVAFATAVVDVVDGGLTGMRVLSGVVAGVGAVVVLAHLLGVLTSDRLR